MSDDLTAPGSLTASALAAHNTSNPPSPKPAAHHNDAGDANSDSDLSEIDEKLFKEYAATERPVIAVDETNVAKLGVHRRKRDADEEARKGMNQFSDRAENTLPKKRRRRQDVVEAHRQQRRRKGSNEAVVRTKKPAKRTKKLQEVVRQHTSPPYCY